MRVAISALVALTRELNGAAGISPEMDLRLAMALNAASGT